MKLADLFSKAAIADSLEARDKKGALKELVEVLKASRKPAPFKGPEVLEALLKREGIGSTGMGSGVAVPHAKLDGVPSLMGAFGRHKAGLDYGAVDGEKVHLVFLIVSPPSEANAHLDALKRISAAVRQANVAKFLKAAKSSKEIHEIFREIDEGTST
jgi:mannitol/fructose-specific phosphotransferase system IIA component (Ntr-type)